MLLSNYLHISQYFPFIVSNHPLYYVVLPFQSAILPIILYCLTTIHFERLPLLLSIPLYCASFPTIHLALLPFQPAIPLYSTSFPILISQYFLYNHSFHYTVFFPTAHLTIISFQPPTRQYFNFQQSIPQQCTSFPTVHLILRLF